MGEEFDEESEVIVLTDEDGEDHEFELIEIFEMDESEYAILAPLDEDEDVENDGGDAIILKVETDDKGERVFSDIEDDEEWEKVAEAWEASLDEDDEWDEDEDEEDDED